MPLTNADIARIESLGHRRADFMQLDDESVPVLLNRDGHCVFLGNDGRCGIYEHRPAGCRLYPLVWDRDLGKVIRDDLICPYTKEFPVDAKREAELLRTLGILEREARERQAYHAPQG